MNHIYTLFQRLAPDIDLGLNFDYMGAAEYEFGSAHAALNVIAVDLGLPKETLTTKIVLGENDAPFGSLRPIDKKSYSWKRLDRRQKEREIERRESVSSMLDGQPLLFRHVPVISDEGGLGKIVSAENFQGFFNKGAIFTQNTQAWLTLSPAPGILYHPSRESLVNTFLEKIAELRREKVPDETELRDMVLKDAVANLRGAVNMDQVLELRKTLRNDTEYPSP